VKPPQPLHSPSRSLRHSKEPVYHLGTADTFSGLSKNFDKACRPNKPVCDLLARNIERREDMDQRFRESIEGLRGSLERLSKQGEAPIESMGETLETINDMEGL